MATVLRIKTSGDLIKATKILSRMRTRIPEISSEFMWKWGRELEQSVKNSAKAAGIKSHTGELFSTGIQWRQRSRTRSRVGHLFIRNYGIALDSMQPHYVNMTQNRSRFLSWGLQADSSAIRRGARNVAAGNKRSHSVYVRPHPYIRTGIMRARNKLTPMLKQHLRDLKNV